MTSIPSSSALSRLQAELEQRCTDKSRAFWNRYLKGNAKFRGVPMAETRKAVHGWWKTEQFAKLSKTKQLEVALALFQEIYAEDKLAGVLILSEILIDDLSKESIFLFEPLFEKKYINDWNLCDWFCVKVLGKMIELSVSPYEIGARISVWKEAKSLWQRRASCVCFVNHAKYGDTKIPGLTELILDNADALVNDTERFAQTGLGWTLRELSTAELNLVVSFVEKNIRKFSREGLKYTIEKMDAEEKKRLLGMHKNASK